MNNAQSFQLQFRSLTKNDPFPWQEDLYGRMMRGEIPEACDIPTGLGKTSIIPIWLIALANGGRNVPRRLVYVVNRRTVVDQSTDEAVEIRERLVKPNQDEPLPEIESVRLALAKSLHALAADPSEDPVAISTLRGQFADNREWSADPSRPAIIVGTVDMIGSRLLFGGYGLGFKTKPMHAGFLGQDALLVHDEAHLEPAFQELIEAIQKEQEDEHKREPSPLGDGMRLKVMALTATPRNFAESEILRISERDRAHPEVRKRIESAKHLNLMPYEDEKKLPDLLCEHALSHWESKRAVLVFARTVEVVEKVAAKLGKTSKVVVLTGTMRGKERDELVRDPTFRRFLPGAELEDETAYLICTSAGEVGVNLSADHLVCDLSTYESMAQRFGRVNRFGARDDTRIDVLHPESIEAKDEYGKRLKKTLDLLRKLDGDGSPSALNRLGQEERRVAFSPEPTILLTSDILFDSWALTTIRDKLPGRPPLEPYLHGLTDREPPITRVAWREEVRVIGESLWARHDPEDLLEQYPLKPHELLRDRSDRVFKHLVTLASRYPNTPAWIVDDDGSVQTRTRGRDGKIRPLTLDDLADKDRKDQLNGRTVVLPDSIGGLKGGLLDGDSEEASDISGEWLNEGGKRRRDRVWDEDPAPDAMRLIRTIDTTPEADGLGQDDQPSKRFWYWYELPKGGDEDGSEDGGREVLWDTHTQDVVRNTTRIVDRLPFNEEIRTSLILAARDHDLGKKRKLFQRDLGARPPDVILAKSGKKKRRVRLAGHYRHEFGSLVDLEKDGEFLALSEERKDLVRHLIAVHHGRGRPHFSADEAFDPESSAMVSELVAVEVPRRFARLQRKFGRWGLAYFESILRAADYAASANPSTEEQP